MRVDSRDNKSIWDAYLLRENVDNSRFSSNDIKTIAFENDIGIDEVDPNDPDNLKIRPYTIDWEMAPKEYRAAYTRVFIDKSSDPVANLKFSEKEKTHRNLPTRNPAENGFSAVKDTESYNDWRSEMARQRGA